MSTTERTTAQGSATADPFTADNLRLPPSGPSARPEIDYITDWYRTLAKEFHPDRRGRSHLGILAINRAKELLLEVSTT